MPVPHFAQDKALTGSPLLRGHVDFLTIRQVEVGEPRCNIISALDW
jgi:hypothetical protein